MHSHRTDRSRNTNVKAQRSRLPKVLLSFVLTVLCALLGYQLWVSYDDHLRAAAVSTTNIATVFETRFAATLQRTDADLIALTLELPRAALLRENVPHYEKEINARLNARLFNVERTDGFHVFDAQGENLYSSDSVPAHKMNVADREYFQRLRDGYAGLIFSEVVHSRISGREILVLARALRDERGRFLGVVINPVDLDFYRQQFQYLRLGETGSLALYRSDIRTKVVGWPRSDQVLNTGLAPHHPLLKQLPSPGSSRSFVVDDFPDHEQRIVSIRSMKAYPFFFAVGLGRNEVLNAWFAQVKLVGAAFALIAAVVSFLLFRLGRMREREAGILTDLSNKESQYLELAQTVPVGLAYFDHEGRHTFVNERYAAMCGRRPEELLGCRWADVIDPDDEAALRSSWAQLARDKEVVNFEVRLLQPNGQRVHVFGEAKTEGKESESSRGSFVALTDISLRKEAEAALLVAKQQAEQANLAKTRFLAAASHDLRQPIQAINLFSDALGRTPLSDEQRSIAGYLAKSVRLLGDLLYSLLDISKLEAGLVKPQHQPFAVEELIKILDTEFSPLAQQRGLRFKLFYPFENPVVYTDAALLLSVVRNLVDNAFKYTERGGVLVGVRKRSGFIVIQVWDTGIGIDEHYGEQVFEECFQIGNHMRDRTKGLGIGLSIAKRTARLLGGDVTFRSRVGRGSMFEMTLPSEHASPSAALPAPTLSAIEQGVKLPQGDPDLVAGWHVVVIEDDPVVAKSVEYSLESIGVIVDVFPDSEMALASRHIAEADFYITDFNMPGMNGLQLLAEIRQLRGGEMDAVLITGETSPERLKLAAESNWPVLFKPAELSGLLSVMSVAARRRQQRSEAVWRI